MGMKDVLKTEAYVALHAQTWRFRAMKYSILIPLFAGMMFWKGWQTTGALFLVLLVVALGVHFLFRWKSKAWTESWGPYKKIDLPK